MNPTLSFFRTDGGITVSAGGGLQGAQSFPNRNGGAVWNFKFVTSPIRQRDFNGPRQGPSSRGSCIVRYGRGAMKGISCRQLLSGRCSLQLEGEHFLECGNRDWSCTCEHSPSENREKIPCFSVFERKIRYATLESRMDGQVRIPKGLSIGAEFRGDEIE